MPKPQVELFDLTEKGKKELNGWLDEHAFQISEHGGPIPLPEVGKFMVVFDADRPKPPDVSGVPVTPTAPIDKVDLEKQREKMRAQPYVKSLQEVKRQAQETIVKLTRNLRALERTPLGNKQQIDISKVQEAKRAIHAVQIDIEETDKLIEELENGKLDEILKKDPFGPKIQLT